MTKPLLDGTGSLAHCPMRSNVPGYRLHRCRKLLSVARTEMQAFLQCDTSTTMEGLGKRLCVEQIRRVEFYARKRQILL
jgi:hypothetical protein